MEILKIDMFWLNPEKIILNYYNLHSEITKYKANMPDIN